MFPSKGVILDMNHLIFSVLQIQYTVELFKSLNVLSSVKKKELKYISSLLVSGITSC